MRRFSVLLVYLLASCQADLEVKCESDDECSLGRKCRGHYCVAVDDAGNLLDDIDDLEDQDDASVEETTWCAPTDPNKLPENPGHVCKTGQPLACHGKSMGRCVTSCDKSLCAAPICNAPMGAITNETSFDEYCEPGFLPLFCNNQPHGCIEEENCLMMAAYRCKM